MRNNTVATVERTGKTVPFRLRSGENASRRVILPHEQRSNAFRTSLHPNILLQKPVGGRELRVLLMGFENVIKRVGQSLDFAGLPVAVVVSDSAICRISGVKLQHDLGLVIEADFIGEDLNLSIGEGFDAA